MAKTKFETTIKLGSKYRDKHGGYEGIAMMVNFHMYACEQVGLERLDKDGKPDIHFFDADRLKLVTDAGKTPKPTTGGPARSVPARPTR